jgi:aspartyl-tRNA(Asn)/glutamyl-tRNA(Gln) amidotransferase subunit A
MLHRITVSELAHRILQGEVSSREATQACLDQIGRVDGQVKAYLNYDAADALAQADAADQLRASGSATPSEHPLLGVPISLKDVIAHKGQPMTCGSRILGNFVSPYDATEVTRLKQALQ